MWVMDTTYEPISTANPATSFPSEGQADPGMWVHVRGVRALVEEIIEHPSGTRIVVARQPDVPDAIYEPDQRVRIECQEITDHLAAGHSVSDGLADECMLCAEEGWGTCATCGVGIPEPGYCSQRCADGDRRGVLLRMSSETGR